VIQATGDVRVLVKYFWKSKLADGFD
jgi:hypothetical protein